MNDTIEKYNEDLESLWDDKEKEITFTEASLKKKIRLELVKECEKYELSNSGTKIEMISRLLNYKESVTVIDVGSAIEFVELDEKGEVKGATGDRV